MKSTFTTRFFCFVVAIPAIAAPLTLSSIAAAQSKVSILNTGSQAGHYWVWNGKPMLPIGDSVTQGWMETGTNFNQTGYIDALAARGMNVAMIWSYIGTDNASQNSDGRIGNNTGYTSPEIWPWQGSIESNTMNLGQFNQAYFDRLKSFVSYAESKDIVVLITVHDGWTKDRFGAHPFNSTQGNGPLTAKAQYVELANYNTEIATIDANSTRQEKNQYYQERFAHKLITELEPYGNVVYEMFNEGEWYNTANRISHEQHFLKFFQDRTDALLLTNAGGINNYKPNEDPRVDVVSLHTTSWTDNYPTFAGAYAKSPTKPVFISEPVPQYDGTNLTSVQIRRGAWEAALAGSGWAAQNDTSFGWDPNSAMSSASKTTARDNLYAETGRVTRFMNDHGLPFWNMAPSTTASETGMALVNSGQEYVTYVPTASIPFKLKFPAAGQQTLNVSWYDPRTGVTASNGTVLAQGEVVFTAPDSNDWVLHVGNSAPTTYNIKSWEFNTTNNHEGWVANAAAHDLIVSGGTWNMAPSGNDPILTGPTISTPAALINFVEIGFRSTNTNLTGQLFWKVQGDSGFSEARSQTFTLLDAVDTHTYLFDVTNDPDWMGQITQLRFDPVATGSGGFVSVDFVRLLTATLPGDFTGDGNVDANDYIVWKKTNIYGSQGYDLWRANYGKSVAAGSLATASIPEPATAALLVGFALAGAFARRTRLRSVARGRTRVTGAP